MNIAFIHTVFPAGGAERVTRDIAAEVRKSGQNGYSFFVYTPNIRHELLTDEFSRHFARISEYSRADEESDLKRLIDEDEIDVIVQVARRVDGIENIRKSTGCKVIMANHGEPFHYRYDIMLRRQRRMWRRILWNLGLKYIYDDFGLAYRQSVRSCRRDYDNCDVYTVLCEDYKTTICAGLGIDEASSHIVAINNSESPVTDVCFEKENIVLFAGRFEMFSKRLDRLLRVWSHVMDKLPDWKLVLSGDGPGLDSMKKMADNLKLKNVDFSGYHNDMSQLYQKSSILCLTSQTEGWGLTLTEAQANGVIPIAFACTAGVKHILSPDGVNGFLVTPYDEEEYADVLLKVASLCEEEKMQLRYNVVEKAKSYSPDIIAKKWKKVFNDLMAGRYV